MPIRSRLLFIMCLLLSTASIAEVYKWVDENGKVRFSDKAPDDKPAESIGAKLEQTNIDSNSKNVTATFSGSTKTQDEIDLEERKKSERESAIGPICKKLKKEIHMIESGQPVAFLDENGAEQIVLEKDRGVKLAEWKAQYSEIGCEEL